MGKKFDSDDVISDPTLCGCRGKPPLNRVVLPAVQSVHDRIDGRSVDISMHDDVGYIQKTQKLERKVEIIHGEANQETSEPKTESGELYSLAATFVNEDTGRSAENLARFMAETYGHRKIPTNIIKGHTVLVRNIPSSIQFFEQVRPHGAPKNGKTVLNVDIIHALPEQSAEKQARVAICNALNDCYSTGGLQDRTIRPIVAHPSESDVSKSECEQWYYEVIPDDIGLLEPCVIEHGGIGWLFGATATASINHEPPRFIPQVQPGDKLLIHRPVGGFAAYMNFVESNEYNEIPEQAIQPMTRDHANVAQEIASFCPPLDDEFSEDKHLKFVTDLSGPGIRGIENRISSMDIDVMLTNLPMLDQEIIENGQDRWALPDATVETNGPLIMIGSPQVVESVRRDLSELSNTDPKVIGRIIDGTGVLRAADDVRIRRLIETFSRDEF